MILRVNQPTPPDHELLDARCPVHYVWRYEAHKEELRALYEKAKKDQWNGQTYLNWQTSVDPEAPLMPDEQNPIFGTHIWNKLNKAEQGDFRRPLGNPPLSDALIGCVMCYGQALWFLGHTSEAIAVADAGLTAALAHCSLTAQANCLGHRGLTALFCRDGSGAADAARRLRDIASGQGFEFCEAFAGVLDGGARLHLHPRRPDRRALLSRTPRPPDPPLADNRRRPRQEPAQSPDAPSVGDGRRSFRRSSGRLRKSPRWRSRPSRHSDLRSRPTPPASC